MVKALAIGIKRFDEGLPLCMRLIQPIWRHFFGLYGVGKAYSRSGTSRSCIFAILELAPGDQIFTIILEIWLKKFPERAIEYYLESLRLDFCHKCLATMVPLMTNNNWLLLVLKNISLDPDAWCNFGLTLFQVEKFEASKPVCVQSSWQNACSESC